MTESEFIMKVQGLKDDPMKVLETFHCETDSLVLIYHAGMIWTESSTHLSMGLPDYEFLERLEQL